MQIIITANHSNDIEYFIRYYLPKYIANLFFTVVDQNKLLLLDKKLKINSFNILKLAVNNLVITHVGNDEFIIKLNNKIKYKGNYLVHYVKLITYGDRTTKGYRILPDIFNYVSYNIMDIYEEYINGYSIL